MTEQAPSNNNTGLLDALTRPAEKNSQKEVSKKEILIVEDSSVIQNAIKRVLEFQEYDVTTAKEGQEALEICNKRPKPFDLILMDVAMPILDGIQCIKSIRALKDRAKAEVPTIAVTGNSEAYTPTEFLRAGFNELHEKPINFDKLSGLVREYLQLTLPLRKRM